MISFNKNLNVLIFCLLSSFTFALAQEKNLEDALGALVIPDNQAPIGLESREKLYSIQNRFKPLKNTVELGAHVGHNLTENGYMDSSQLGAGTRFHFSNRWNVGVDGSLVFNKLSAPGNRLLKEEGLIPDYAYTISRFDATAGFNTFYGKMRFDMDQVIYFDQYVTLGAGLVRQNTALARAAVSDIGFAFWIGKQGVVRLGVKNYLFKEVRQLSSSVVHHGLLHLDVNFLLGGST